MIKENYFATYTPSEEKANVITHGFGVLLSFIALAFLIYYSLQNHILINIVSSIIFGLSLVTLYCSSTLYHACKGKPINEIGSLLSSKKRFFRILDHSSIYILISGSYTPLVMIPLHNRTSYTICIILWSCSLICIALKFFFVNSFKILSTISYVGMGWAALFILKSLYQTLPLESFAFVIIGGFFYTFGLSFYFLKKIPYHHAVWHLFVMAGSTFHFFAVVLILKSLGSH